MLREAQRESARSSARVSPISSAMMSLSSTCKNTPSASPKSPPNSPNTELANYEENLKGVVVNREPDVQVFDYFYSLTSTGEKFSFSVNFQHLCKMKIINHL
jgi:hypothetical protein